MTARRIAILIFPDFQILDATGPIAAFEIAGRYVEDAYDIKVIAAEAGQVRSSAGVAMIAEAFAAGGRLDTLVIAGGEGSRGPSVDERVLGFVRATAASARRTTSVCSGAYILAAAGLLDGRRATTHWNRSRDFARRFPKVRLEPDRIYVRDGAIWTSAGITAGIDLALAMIAEDLGETIARQVAQQLVVFHRRPGGQSQFSALLELDHPGGRFGALMNWAHERLHEQLSVERLAKKAAMSPRNFARAFAADTGVTPARAIERLRVEMARERVEAGLEPIDKVAETAGFGDAERMRRAFLRAFGQPPQALRRAARGGRMRGHAMRLGRTP
jgi:transcriptional regulator GlxA family with amidase domain